MKTNRKIESLLLLLMIALSVPRTRAAEVEKYLADSTLHLPSNIDINRQYLVGAVSTTSGTNLERTAELQFTNTLQGELCGFTSIANAGGLDGNAASLYIRGLHSVSNNSDIITIVDGVAREIDNLLPQEIESITVVKDATTKILYGAQATNGAILITTKRGYCNAPRIRITAEYGVGVVQNYADYLNSYDYARLYNEACENDGITPLYTEADILGYRDSAGVNDLRYPDVDYVEYFLRNTTAFQRYTIEFNGSNDRLFYSVNAGYTGNSGVENVGKQAKVDKLNLNSNLGLVVNDWITARLGISNTFTINNYGSKGSSGLFSAISTHRPNEYPLTISSDYIDLDTQGNMAFGASFDQSENLYGDLLYGGSTRQQNIVGRANLELDFNLSWLTEGLSLSAMYAYDNYFLGYEVNSSSVATYAQRWYSDASGVESPTFYMMNVTETDDEVSLTSSSNRRATSFLAKLNYQRTFNNDHRVDGSLSFYNYAKQYTGTTQDDKALNLLLRANYSYRNKYVVEASTALMGSHLYYGSNRYMQSWSAGAGWIVSKEDFMSRFSNINFLKIKASAGLLGYDSGTAYLYENRWKNDGTFNIARSVTIPVVSSVNVGNEDLDWEKSLEFNVGAEMSLLDNRLWIETNYFRERRSNMLTQVTYDYSALYGDYFPYQNYGKVRNQGIELEAIYSDRHGDFSYKVGVNAVYSKNKIIEGDDLYDVDSNANTIRNSTDTMYGYVSEGLFGRDIDLDGHTTQALGYYTTGDIAYSDLNGDDVVDELDQQKLGNSFPRTNIGLSAEFNYKGFGLYLQGVSYLGYDVWLNNSYYWVNGDDKYSAITADRYHPTYNPDGEYPRLTTTESYNNHRNSDFWMESGNFFKLKKVEVSYTFGESYNLGAMSRLKVFVRANNLFTASKIKDFDPEAMAAGLTTYPLFTTITGGVNLTF